MRVRIDRRSQTLETDADGVCRIELPARQPNSASVSAYQEGFAPRAQRWSPNGQTSVIPAEHTLALEPGTSIGGRVQDEDGNPIAGVESTIVGADWTNAVADEIIAVIENSGLTLQKTNNAQLWQAIQAAANAR